MLTDMHILHCILPVTEVLVVGVDLYFNLFFWFDRSSDWPGELLRSKQFLIKGFPDNGFIN